MPDQSYNTVFETIVEEESDLVGLVAYGHYKRKKRDWIINFTERNQRPPNSTEVESYVIGENTPRMIDMYRSRAREELAAYAAYVVEAETPAIREAALGADILSKVDRKTHWAPSIGFNVLGAFIYTLLLVLVALILKWSGVDLLTILASAAQ